MCGIVGVFGDINEKEKKAFRDMLCMDVIRGQDSTGILNIPANPSADPEIYKDLGHPINLWDPLSTTYVKKFSDRGVVSGFTRGLLGHNRAATMGSITVDTAHPFQFDDIYGVHNGTLYHTYELEGNHEVDSMCIYDTIDCHGIDHTWERLSGAAALVWWDANKKLLNFCRNEERPLFMCLTEGGKSLFLASESWMIQAAMLRNGVKPALDGSGKAMPPKMIDTNHLYSFEVNVTNVKLKEDRKLKKRVFRPQTTGGISSSTKTTAKQSAFKGTGSTTTIPDKPKGKSILINQGWAGNSPKMDKEYKETEVVLRFSISSWSQQEGVWKFWIMGTGPKGEKVYLYPSRMGGYEKWNDLVEKASANNQTLTVRLNVRPRGNDKVGTVGGVIRASADKMTVVKTVTKIQAPEDQSKSVPEPLKGVEEKELFPIYQGLKVPEDGFIKALKAAADCCCNCGEVLTVDDAQSIEWLGKFHVACSGCKDDPNLQLMMGGLS